MTVTSDFSPEVEIWPFRVYAIRHMHYNLYLWMHRQNSLVLQKIWVKEVNEVDGDVRFQTGCRNMAIQSSWT